MACLSSAILRLLACLVHRTFLARHPMLSSYLIRRTWRFSPLQRKKNRCKTEFSWKFRIIDVLKTLIGGSSRGWGLRGGSHVVGAMKNLFTRFLRPPNAPLFHQQHGAFTHDHVIPNLKPVMMFSVSSKIPKRTEQRMIDAYYMEPCSANVIKI